MMDLKPTSEMAKNAERGLKLRKEYGRGGTEVGVARATQLKNRENLSPETVKRMVSYFARHAGDNLSETDPPSAGYIAWLLWGGDAGRDWAERKAKQIDEQQENSTMNNSTTSIKKLPDYKGLECELKTTVFEKQPLNDPRRYSHVAICDELGIRSRGYPDAASAVAELKKLVDASMKDRDNSLTQKKLAIIKSNAAPEVKLRALEILSNDNKKEYQNISMSIEKGQYKGFEYEVIGDPWPEPKKYAARSTVVPHKLKKAGKTLFSSWESKPESALQDLKKKIDEYLAAQNSYKNADSKLDPAKLALSKMLDQLGYKAMAREVMQESDIQALKKYSRVVISEFEKAKSPKADRVKALLGQLGVGV